MNRLSDISENAELKSEGFSDALKFYPEFSLELENNSLKGTLLEIGAENCISCRRMKTTLEEIEEKYANQLIIQSANITEADGLRIGKQFGLVMIPMQVLMNRKGEVVYKHIGYISSEELSKSIEAQLEIP